MRRIGIRRFSTRSNGLDALGFAMLRIGLGLGVGIKTTFVRLE
jgi:hypothetical protein